MTAAQGGVTIKELAARAGVTSSNVNWNVNRGNIPARRVGRRGRQWRWVIAEVDAVAYVAAAAKRAATRRCPHCGEILRTPVSP